MFIITSQIYQQKIKWKGGGSYFYKNKKYRRLEIEQKIFFSYFIWKTPNFSRMGFSQNAQCIVGALL